MRNTQLKEKRGPYFEKYVMKFKKDEELLQIKET